jgi:hypothetical protein
MASGNRVTYHRNLFRSTFFPASGNLIEEKIDDYQMSSETMVSDDVLIPYRVKPVSHTKRTNFPLKFTIERVDFAPWLGEYETTYRQTDYLSDDYMGTISQWLNSKLSEYGTYVDWDAVKENAMPSLRNQFNTLNFLAEADDLPKLAKSLAGKVKLLQAAIKRREEASRLLAKKRELIAKLSTASADQILEYNLGIAPTIGDAETLYKNLGAPIHALTESVFDIHSEMLDEIQRRNKKIDFAKRNAARGVRGHHVIGETGGVDVLGPFLGYQGVRFQLRVTWSLRARANAHFTGRYATDNMLSNILDGAGIYPDLATLWNALPFTFLIDYVFPFGKYLEKSHGSWSWNDVFNGGSKAVKISRATVTRKITCTFFVEPLNERDVMPSGDWGIVWKSLVPGNGQFNIYERWLPDHPELDGIDVKHEKNRDTVDRQWLNAGALATGPVVAAARKRKML